MKNNEFYPLFIPSYKRANNLLTVKLFKKLGYDMSKIFVFIDNEADDKDEYLKTTAEYECNLVVFDIEEARKRYDYVHLAPKSGRSVGQARNMFYDYAKQRGITEYFVIDDDTETFIIRNFGIYTHVATGNEVINTIRGIFEFIRKRHIGAFGLPQDGDFYGSTVTRLLRHKIMNFTFINTKYIYRPERGCQDEDTAMFVSLMNEGYFTETLFYGVTLKQKQSAVQKGGLTELYNELKLLNKALVTPIQYPSAIHAEKQIQNGGRLHHKIAYRYLYPKLLKVDKGNNIAWDTYPEDVVFTNEPNRGKSYDTMFCCIIDKAVYDKRKEAQRG